ncbi:hypothetical protein [Halobacteriovorax sp.]|uniref:hypothetical protein n=1 Tax=Halobacteriovorax sp. TaxID=2020862 RepID=UPI003563A4F5
MFNQTRDEIYLLNTIDRWRNLQDSQEDYEDIHTLNAQDYISSLNPIFLTAFKNLESLNNFSFIQSRDGILDLIHFFNLYREPRHTLTKILINSKFSHIIPNKWLSNIIFYEDRRTKDISPETNTLVYESGFRNDSIDEDSLYKLTKKYKFDRLFITGEALPKRTDLFHKEVSKCEEILNLKSKYLTRNSIFSFTEENSILYKDNYSDIMFSKSFVSRILSTNGVLPVNYSGPIKDTICDTPYTGINLVTLPEPQSDPLKIYEWLDNNHKKYQLEDLFEQLDNTNNTRKFYFDSTYQFAKSIFENNNKFY